MVHLSLQIFDSKLVQHDNIVVSVLSKQAFEANRAQVILAEGLDVLSLMDLALGVENAASHAIDRLSVTIVGGSLINDYKMEDSIRLCFAL